MGVKVYSLHMALGLVVLPEFAPFSLTAFVEAKLVDKGLYSFYDIDLLQIEHEDSISVQDANVTGTKAKTKCLQHERNGLTVLVILTVKVKWLYSLGGERNVYIFWIYFLILLLQFPLSLVAVIIKTSMSL